MRKKKCAAGGIVNSPMREQLMAIRPRFADGGIIPADSGSKETPEQLLARMKAKYGLGDSGKPSQPPVQQPSSNQSAAATSQQVPSGGLVGKVLDATGRRAEELNRVSRYARGGIMPVMGKGTSTSDSIPAVVAGQRVSLSNGEGAAILPAKTMQNKAAVHAIEEIIEATNGKPPVSRDDEKDGEGMACGGVAGKRKMQYGGVLDPEEEQKRRMADHAVPTLAPTSQEVYQPAVDTTKGIASAAFPSTMSAVQKYGDMAESAANQGNYGGAIGQVARGGIAGVMGMGDDLLRSAAYALDPAANALKTFVTGDSTPINAAKLTTSSPDASAAQVSHSNEGQLTAPNTAISQDSARLSSSIGNVGNARFNAQNGILSFTDKAFDPTKQQLSPGTGAVTDPRTGRTMVVTGAPALDTSGQVDSFGNSTARTDQMKAELAAMQKNGSGTAPASGPQISMLQSLPGEREDRNRFSQFVRQTEIDRLAKSGNRTALGLIGRGISDEAGFRAQKELAAIQGANQATVEAQRGQNQLATTSLLGNNALAVEGVRQSSPEKRLAATKASGEIADADAVRAARNELAIAATSGNQSDYAKAVRKGIAFGILKPEKQDNSPYKFHSDPMGNAVRINEATGATDVLDRATNTLKPVSAPAADQVYSVKVGMPVKAEDGIHTFQGKQITVKSGKVIEVK